MKKVISFALVLALIFSLAACGKKKNSDIEVVKDYESQPVSGDSEGGQKTALNLTSFNKFVNGYAWVKSSGSESYSLIDTSGKIICTSTAIEIHDMSNDACYVKEKVGDKDGEAIYNYKIINKDGKIVASSADGKFDEILAAGDNLFFVHKYESSIDVSRHLYGTINEKGEFVSIDKFMVIIWSDMYNKIDKKEGFYDVKCSKVVSDEMIKLGLKPIEVRTGNSYTKKISVDNNYPFGGELSGHLYFRDKFIGTDDGIYAGLRLVEILSHNPKKVSNLLEGITKYYNYPEGKFTVEDSKKDIIVSRVEEYCKEKGYNYSKIDGIKVLYDDGFALVRKSNTGPNITTRYKSSDKEKLELIKQEFDSLIIKYSKE